MGGLQFQRTRKGVFALRMKAVKPQAVAPKLAERHVRQTVIAKQVNIGDAGKVPAGEIQTEGSEIPILGHKGKVKMMRQAMPFQTATLQ